VVIWRVTPSDTIRPIRSCSSSTSAPTSWAASSRDDQRVVVVDHLLREVDVVDVVGSGVGVDLVAQVRERLEPAEGGGEGGLHARRRSGDVATEGVDGDVGLLPRVLVAADRDLHLLLEPGEVDRRPVELVLQGRDQARGADRRPGQAGLVEHGVAPARGRGDLDRGEEHERSQGDQQRQRQLRTNPCPWHRSTPRSSGHSGLAPPMYRENTAFSPPGHPLSQSNY
jgi:hypothetical protein